MLPQQILIHILKAGQNLNGLKVVFVILIVYHHRFIKTEFVYVKICLLLMMKDTVVLVTTKVMNLLVFVVANTKMKKDYAVVETLILSVVMNVFVFHHTPETLGVIVVVLKLILILLLMIPMVILYGVVVNATVLCREV
jgi:hypothetical protein